MSAFVGIAILMIAFGIMTMLVLGGLATVIWSKRCDPKNKAFTRPRSVFQLGLISKLSGQIDKSD
ncbi:MAG TPA: hypothetical protein DD861_03335 [Erythrobacter sp.]|nr:hypothetical protein [Erythrobacter sp.]